MLIACHLGIVTISATHRLRGKNSDFAGQKKLNCGTGKIKTQGEESQAAENQNAMKQEERERPVYSVQAAHHMCSASQLTTCVCKRCKPLTSSIGRRHDAQPPVGGRVALGKDKS